MDQAGLRTSRIAGCARQSGAKGHADAITARSGNYAAVWALSSAGVREAVNASAQALEPRSEARRAAARAPRRRTIQAAPGGERGAEAPPSTCADLARRGRARRRRPRAPRRTAARAATKRPRPTKACAQQRPDASPAARRGWPRGAAGPMASPGRPSLEHAPHRGGGRCRTRPRRPARTGRRAAAPLRPCRISPSATQALPRRPRPLAISGARVGREHLPLGRAQEDGERRRPRTEQLEDPDVIATRRRPLSASATAAQIDRAAARPARDAIELFAHVGADARAERVELVASPRRRRAGARAASRRRSTEQLAQRCSRRAARAAGSARRCAAGAPRRRCRASGAGPSGSSVTQRARRAAGGSRRA